MNKSARFSFKQQGVINPILLAVGGIIIVVVVISVATGAFKFSGSIRNDADQPTATQPSTEVTEDEEKASAATKTYTNEALGISLEYTDGWSMKENPASGVVVAFGSPKESSDDKFVDNINLSTTDLSSQPMTLDKLTDTWLKQTQDAAEFKLVDRKSTLMAGGDAEQLVYTYTNQGVNIKGSVTIATKNNTAYIITYTAEETSYDKFIDSANTAVTSLKVE